MPASNVVQLPGRETGPARMTAAAGSSFGLNMTTLGPQFDAQGLVGSDRVRELEFREKFFTCRHHDHKVFDFNGRMIRPGRLPEWFGTQPLIGNNLPSFYVPMDMRRPNTPYRIARKVVSSFTAMLFGHGRWPEMKSDDPDTEDFANGLEEATGLKAKFIRARNIGGRCGTVALSWAFVDGRPRVNVHNGKHVHVLEWEDEDERIPRHAVELYQYVRSVFDPKKRKMVKRWFWHRRDWTPVADVFFQSIEVSKKNPEMWIIDEERSFEHHDGFTHLVYIENLPDDDVNTTDGAPDYAETYEQQSSLDTLNSVNVGGAVKNLDPTLVLKMPFDATHGAVIKKGSENALTVGETGDAKYMEVSGASVAAGSALVSEQANQILETAECVSPDPNEVLAAGTSAVGMKMLYSPMLNKTDVLRDQYGKGIELLVTQMTVSARLRAPNPNAETEEERWAHVPVVDEETGEPKFDEETGEQVLEPVEFFLDLPPRIESEEVLDEQGNPTGETREVKVDRRPGSGRVWIEWGDYFKPTSDDRQKDAGALTTATGGQPVLSQRTAVEQNAKRLGIDPGEEWVRVSQDNERRAQQDAMMTPPIGDFEDEETPPGGEA